MYQILMTNILEEKDKKEEEKERKIILTLKIKVAMKELLV